MMLIRARWIHPVSSPPIENGTVAVEGDRIVHVGKNQRGPIIDLGEATLLPGLVNAHAHLEFSHLKGKTASGIPFTAWVRDVVRLDTEPKPIPSAGIRRLLETGTTTVADHGNPETPPFETPFRRIPFWEILGVEKGRAAASAQKAQNRASSEGGFVTPHSLYSVHREVLDQWPLRSVHLLESADEDRLIREGTGPLADYIRERGGHVEKLTRWGFGGESGLVPGTLLIHGNYVRNEEIRLLINRGVTVVHCPGSHRFFGHRKFPLEEFRKTGIPIALGTDSLASNEDLSMLREMRLFREAYPNIGDDEILRIATLEGAAALGMKKEIGSIEVGKKADLVAVAGPDVLKAENVLFSMINGDLCLTP